MGLAHEHGLRSREGSGERRRRRVMGGWERAPETQRCDSSVSSPPCTRDEEHMQPILSMLRPRTLSSDALSRGSCASERRLGGARLLAIGRLRVVDEDLRCLGDIFGKAVSI